MATKVLALLSSAAVALLVASPGRAGAQESAPIHAGWLARTGDAGTGVQVQNLDEARTAQIRADLYPQNGQAPVRLAAEARAGGAATFYLPAMPLPVGAYAAIVSSDRPIAAIARTDWPRKGRAAMYSNLTASTDVVLALVAGDQGGQCSQISIQNTDASAAAVATVEFHATGSTSAAYTRDYLIQRGTSVTLRPCSDPELVTALPRGYLGSLRVKAKDGSTRFAVQSFVDVATSEKAVYAFEGVPADQAATELYAPLFRASQPLGPVLYGDTAISVVNTGNADIDVTVTFYPSSLAASTCSGTFTHTLRVKADSSTLFWQGPGAGHGIPAGCFGSARISASGNGRIVATVIDSLDALHLGRFSIQSAAYNAVGAAGAGRKVALPLFRTGHTQSNLWTGISVMNVGSGSAHVQLSVQHSGGQTSENAMMMFAGPNETAIFWPYPITMTPPWFNAKDAYGSATITSDQPVVVIVNDTSQAREPDRQLDSAIYSGIKVGP